MDSIETLFADDTTLGDEQHQDAEDTQVEAPDEGGEIPDMGYCSTEQYVSRGAK